MSFTDQFSQSQEAAGYLYSLVHSFLCEKGVPHWIANGVAAVLSGSIIAIGAIYAAVIALMVGVAPEFAKAVLKIISDVRQQGIPEFTALASSVLSEFLGFEIDTTSFNTSPGIQGAKDRAHAIGTSLHEALLAEFAGSSPITPEQGKASAERFSGFAINFAVANSFVSIMGEMLSFGKFEQFRELGIEVAQNLGLGRLQRGALQPIIDNLITKPYDRLLRKQTRPDSLNEIQLVHAMNSGGITPELVREQLAEKGYRDEYIEELIKQLSPHLTDVEVERLRRHGVITDDQSVAQLVAEGWTKENAALKLQAVELAPVDNLVQQALAHLRIQAINKFIDTETFGTIIDKFPISEGEKVWNRGVVGFVIEVPRKRPTHAEVVKMFTDGIIDLHYFDAWTDGEGYSTDDQLNLELLMLAELKQAKDKATAKLNKATRAGVKAAMTPPSTSTGG